jgi:hypothetical protein
MGVIVTNPIVMGVDLNWWNPIVMGLNPIGCKTRGTLAIPGIRWRREKGTTVQNFNFNLG